MALLPALVLAGTGVGAQADPSTAQPERPTVATHAGTVAPGWLEIETGLEVDRSPPPDARTGVVVPTLFKFGVARRLQMGLQLPLTAPSGSGLGPGDLSVAFKFGFGKGFAVQPAVKLPTGREAAGRGTGTADGSLLLIWSRPLGPVAMDLNAGITRRSGDGTGAPRTATVWTASFGGPGDGPVGWVAECFGYPRTGGPVGAAGTVGILAGPTFRVNRRMVLDAGGILRIRGPQANALYLGLTWNAGRYWSEGRRRSPPPRPSP